MAQYKVGVVGGPSSGKTALTLALAEALKMRHYDVRMLNEYATEYLENVGKPTNVFEQLAIAIGQEEIEQRALAGGRKSRDFLICDGASFLARVYAMHYFKLNPADDRQALAKFNYALKKLDDWGRKRFFPSYDAIFFVPLEHGYFQDSIRFQGSEAEALAVQEAILAYLRSEGARYTVLRGTKEERMQTAVDILAALKQKNSGPV